MQRGPLATMVLLLACACGGQGTGPDTDGSGGSETGVAAASSGDTSEPTGGGMSGSGGATETTTSSDPGAADFMAVEACDAIEVCPPWTEAFVDAQAQTLPPERQCVFEGLRDGTVGRYTYVAEHTTATLMNTTTTLFLVHPDRKVTYVQHHVGQVEGEAPHDVYDRAWRCEMLSMSDFFAACTTADMTDKNCFWLTDQFNLGLPWWTLCAQLPPSCG